LSAEQAAIGLARFAAVMDIPLDQIGRLGATMVGLGNNFAAFESEILDISLRLAGAGKTAGLTSAEVMGLGTALKAVGLNTELAGTAMARSMTEIQKAVATSNEKLAMFAHVAGMTAEEFSARFRADAAGAILAFVEGLRHVDEAARIQALEALDLDAVRTMQTFLNLSGATGKLREALERAREEFEKGNAHIVEASRRWSTLSSELQKVRNLINDIAIRFGDDLAPTIRALLGIVRQLLESFAGMSAATRQLATGFLIVLAAIGPLSLATKAAIVVFKQLAATWALIAANPAGLLALALSILTVAVWNMYKEWDSFRIAFLKLWEYIKQGVGIAVRE